MTLFKHIPATVKIVEVGPRDGLQNESMTLTSEQRVHLIEQLSKAGLKNIEAGSFVSPKWVPQMASTHEVLQASKAFNINLPVLVPNEKGLDAAIEAGAEEIAVFTATSEAFCLKNTNCTVEESLERIRQITILASQKGIRVRGYVSTVLDCPYDGPQDPQKCADISAELIKMGCYEVSLGDTIGHGTPIRTETLIQAVVKKVPVNKLAVHFHDTRGQALSNLLVALQMGISVIDSSIGGLGGCPYAKGASGNVATEDVVYMLQGMGIETHVDLNQLVVIAQEMSQLLQKQLPGRVHKAY